MDGFTLYTLRWVEDVLIVVFALLYFSQYRDRSSDLKLYALSRLLQGGLWFVYSLGDGTPGGVLVLARASLSFGIALECYCFIRATAGGSRRSLTLLLAMASLITVVDLAAQGFPRMQQGIGNLISGIMLLYTAALMILHRANTNLQRVTGWLIVGRALLILLGSLLIDGLGHEASPTLKPWLNSIAASASIFLPMVFIFLLKEQVDREVEQQQRELKTSHDALERSNATKNTLLSILSHDLRSPFASIVSIVDLLAAEKSEHAHDPESAESIRMLQETCSEYMRLIDNLLQWTSVQSDQIQLELQPLKLADQLQGTLKVYEPTWTQKQLTVDVQGIGDYQVMADKFMFDTIIRNLLSNAIKFSHPGASITLTTKAWDGELALSIIDSGVGMTPEQLQHLFQELRSSTTVGTANEKGTGLGLVLCRGFAQRMGGRITVDSKVGSGSTFTLWLPLA